MSPAATKAETTGRVSSRATSAPAGGSGETPAGSSRTPRRDRLTRQNLAGWLYSTPFLVFFLTFMALPIVATFVMSFTDFGLRNVTDPFGAKFLGLDNYIALAHDEKFVRALCNTGYFVVAGVPLTIGSGLVAAVLLNSGIDRLRTFFRVGFYVPVVTAIVAVAVIWRFVLDPSEGLIAGLGAQLGFTAPDFLASKGLAMPSLIVMAVWRNMGTAMVLFLAGLQAIATEVREAARIDGAGAFQEFRKITVPLLRPTMLYVAVMTTIGFLNVFEEPFVMTDGGPGDSTLTVSLHMYQQGFRFFHMGSASAMAYVLFTIVLAITLLQLRLLKDKTR